MLEIPDLQTRLNDMTSSIERYLVGRYRSRLPALWQAYANTIWTRAHATLASIAQDMLSRRAHDPLLARMSDLQLDETQSGSTEELEQALNTMTLERGPADFTNNDGSSSGTADVDDKPDDQNEFSGVTIDLNQKSDDDSASEISSADIGPDEDSGRWIGDVGSGASHQRRKRGVSEEDLVAWAYPQRPALDWSLSFDTGTAAIKTYNKTSGTTA